MRLYSIHYNIPAPYTHPYTDTYHPSVPIYIYHITSQRQHQITSYHITYTLPSHVAHNINIKRNTAYTSSSSAYPHTTITSIYDYHTYMCDDYHLDHEPPSLIPIMAALIQFYHMSVYMVSTCLFVYANL